MGEERGWRGRRVADLERDYLELDVSVLTAVAIGASPGGGDTRQEQIRSEMDRLRRQFDVDDASSYQRRRGELRRA